MEFSCFKTIVSEMTWFVEKKPEKDGKEVPSDESMNESEVPARANELRRNKEAYLPTGEKLPKRYFLISN